MNDLENFIIESNNIEGEKTLLEKELPIYEWWLANECNEKNLLLFHKKLADVRDNPEEKYRGVYRDCAVWIAGRECSAHMLDGRMWDFWNDFDKCTPYENHMFFERLHPFVDLNGRTGRAVWLHQMLETQDVPLGFLHTWYYQSLSNSDK